MFAENNSEKILPVGEPELIDHEHLLGNRGLALEAACGKAGNALYLATLGYEVIATDFAIAGLRLCQPTINELNLSVSLLACDLENQPFVGNRFELVSVVRYLHRPLFSKLKSWVAPGGLIFYKTFNREFLTINPGFNPDYVLEIGELNDVFSNFQIISSDHNSSSASAMALKGTSYILARKPI